MTYVGKIGKLVIPKTSCSSSYLRLLDSMATLKKHLQKEEPDDLTSRIKHGSCRLLPPEVRLPKRV
jgi:hypothetical protein